MINKKSKKINKITISLASKEFIIKKSCGQVLKPDTINYRTHKPEFDGLFCQRIFGPIKDYECACGKYKSIRYKGLTCENCGVSVVENKVRRNRIGHISLVVPIVHVWYFKSIPNQIGKILGCSPRILDKIIYYERYLVLQPGVAIKPNGSPVNKYELITEDDYMAIKSNLHKSNSKLDDNDPKKFIAKIGAECIEYLLKNINLDDIYDQLRWLYTNDIYEQRRLEYLKRLQVVADFIYAEKNKKINKEWMITYVIPVLPPELRPIIPLEGGKYATSDINELYRRIIIRNNRLKKLIVIQAPEVIIRYEKRMLQESVDDLYDNTQNQAGSENRILKSLSDYIRGKHGRFRLNLLGKRVDYSARSVIVVGPNLKLYECGLPKEIASELYKPFLIRKLLDIGLVQTVRHAKQLIDNKKELIWNILKIVIQGHPILLNRAPTLHKLGILAFQPILIEGKSIQLHPLVCTAFNADFDGDQMAVHLPLSNEAILEAQLLMLSSQNILNAANGDPVTVPSQDMVLGLYYMTKEINNSRIINNIIFSSIEEVEIAYNQKLVEIHDKIKIIINNLEKTYTLSKIIDTTVGRVLFNKFIPPQVGYINKLISKKAISEIIKKIFVLTNVTRTVKFLDSIKELGFENSYKGGLSINLVDCSLLNDYNNEQILIKSLKITYKLIKKYYRGLINNHERYKKVLDLWTNTNKFLTKIVMDQMYDDQNEFNSIYMMLDSGARGSKEQIKQITVMRGLISKPIKYNYYGEILETPILSNYRDGITILEYFYSTHSARKGLADTALKTADAGYLTRRLVDVAQEIIIREKDCGTLRGITIHSIIKSNYDIGSSFYNRILGRIALQNIYNNKRNQILVYSNNMIDDKSASEIEKLGIEHVYVRSPITCESQYGICAKCYGMNLAKGDIVQKGEAVGVIAAQSIGEPGTQLTLRTFHVGGTGTFGKIYETSYKIITTLNGIVVFERIKILNYKDHNNINQVVLSRSAYVQIKNTVDGSLISTYSIPYGSILLVSHGELIRIGTKLCLYDIYNTLIISEVSGIVNYKLIDNYCKINVLNYNGTIKKKYNINWVYTLKVDNGKYIQKGQLLARIIKNQSEKKEITVGLPRVTELCEARDPYNHGIVSEMDGIVHICKIPQSKTLIIVISHPCTNKIYIVPQYSKIMVHEKQLIQAGTTLSEGSIKPKDILSIKGPSGIKEYLINEIQTVYRLQGVQINDKHFEIILRKMMRHIQIIYSGHTKFIPNSIEYKEYFLEENEILISILIIDDNGDSNRYEIGQIITIKEYKLENDILISGNKKVMKCRYIHPSIGKPILQGITKASLLNKSFISAASFQDTTKVLKEAAIMGKTDDLIGIKENVVVGNPIPAGTGFEEYDNIIIE